MKLHTICKYVGLASGALAGLLIIGGILRYFNFEIFNVRYYATFFWLAETFAVFGIFAMVVYIACKDKDKEK